MTQGQPDQGIIFTDTRTERQSLVDPVSALFPLEPLLLIWQCGQLGHEALSCRVLVLSVWKAGAALV